MTEEEWLMCRDPIPMLNEIQNRFSDRKLYLIALACGWRRLHLEVDGGADMATLRAIMIGLEAAIESADMEAAICTIQSQHPSFGFDRGAWNMAYGFAYGDIGGKQKHKPLSFIRDILGNPFRPVTFLPEWRAQTVLALAQQMYGTRDFTAMPILADALQDAGCDDEAILTHCRGPGPHVRGCHVVDVCLGKS